MLDFYTELKRFKRAPEPKDLKKMITEERRDFIDMALSVLYGGMEKPPEATGGEDKYDDATL
ncbi:MAG: hypothetical protein Q4P30_05045 [Eubacteriales bacterium]|nr:hypothetical protein [Eubacteriales bacterium]